MASLDLKSLRLANCCQSFVFILQSRRSEVGLKQGDRKIEEENTRKVYVVEIYLRRESQTIKKYKIAAFNSEQMNATANDKGHESSKL